MSVMSFSRTALKNLRSRPATLMYPMKKRESFARTRGHIERIDGCVLCGLCAKKCPTKAITVDRPAKKWSIDRFNCIQCGSCVESCNKKALVMRGEYTPPSTAKRTDEFTDA
jgi:Formate hydrogenlyase subunit 6/NADH:ubiquinone oxidoreductase 23 kD subunit (chain I)